MLGGEGDFDLPAVPAPDAAAGWRGAICYELSVQVQQRPDYDALAAPRRTYRWMADGLGAGRRPHRLSPAGVPAARPRAAP